MTQWCFGPPVFDRVFLYSGGRCEGFSVTDKGEVEDLGIITIAAKCRKVGGSWEGGFDVSGHVFLLVLGSWLLAVELGVAIALEALEATRRKRRMDQGKGGLRLIAEAIGLGGGLAAVVMLLGVWMLLITAAFFHTWYEKVSFCGFIFRFCIDADRVAAFRAVICPGRGRHRLHRASGVYLYKEPTCGSRYLGEKVMEPGQRSCRHGTGKSRQQEQSQLRHFSQRWKIRIAMSSLRSIAKIN